MTPLPIRVLEDEAEHILGISVSAFVWDTHIEFQAPGVGPAQSDGCRHLHNKPVNGKSALVFTYHSLFPSQIK